LGVYDKYYHMCKIVYTIKGTLIGLSLIVSFFFIKPQGGFYAILGKFEKSIIWRFLALATNRVWVAFVVYAGVWYFLTELSRKYTLSG